MRTCSIFTISLTRLPPSIDGATGNDVYA
jgi:hypothetical protein